MKIDLSETNQQASELLEVLTALEAKMRSIIELNAKLPMADEHEELSKMVDSIASNLRDIPSLASADDMPTADDFQDLAKATGSIVKDLKEIPG